MPCSSSPASGHQLGVGGQAIPVVGQAGGAGDGVAVQGAELADVGTVSAKLWWWAAKYQIG